jgi:hypothetical protein
MNVGAFIFIQHLMMNYKNEKSSLQTVNEGR